MPDPDAKKEWKKHKYIDKVTTKTGNIRYIYEQNKKARAHSQDMSNRNVARAAQRLATDVGFALTSRNNTDNSVDRVLDSAARLVDAGKHWVQTNIMRF